MILTVFVDGVRHCLLSEVCMKVSSFVSLRTNWESEGCQKKLNEAVGKYLFRLL